MQPRQGKTLGVVPGCHFSVALLPGSKLTGRENQLSLSEFLCLKVRALLPENKTKLSLEIRS